MNNQIARQQAKTILIDDVRVMFRNFSGKPGQFNAAGQRNFHILLPQEAAQDLESQGFNVKYLKAREEGEVPQAHLKINVNLTSNIPPKIIVVNSKGRRQLTEDMMDMLDWAEFEKVDLIFARYQREWPDGRTTVTAYLQTFFGFIREDELELRYNDIPELESAQNVLVWQENDPDDLDILKMQELEG